MQTSSNYQRGSFPTHVYITKALHRLLVSVNIFSFFTKMGRSQIIVVCKGYAQEMKDLWWSKQENDPSASYGRGQMISPYG